MGTKLKEEILELTQGGENEKMEFKSTLRINLHTNEIDRKIEDSLGKPLFEVITEVKDQVYKGLLDDIYRNVLFEL